MALIARAIDWSPIGVALRGFGNNAAAMRRSGWSPTRYALVRYFIELHGGTVHAESAGEGTGATFRTLIPLAAEPPAA